MIRHLVLLALLAAGPAAAQSITVGDVPQSVPETYVGDPPGREMRIWSRGLDVPWSLVFLPDGRALVSERPGRLRLIARDGTLAPEPVARVEVRARGEGGLMGIALHPDFPRQPFVYAMRTVEKNGVTNEVVRLRLEGERATLDRVILGGIVGGTYHNGGRIGFGPDRMLYVTAGERFEAALAQDPNALGGKILRVTPEGAIPPDNPFPGSPVWSLGHRNPQGLAWHPRTGELFITEHGPSGEFGRRRDDEVNVVRKGGNYGWPLFIGAARRAGYADPILLWRDTGAPPSGATFWEGALMVATLRSRALIRVAVEPGGPQGWQVTAIERWFSTAPDRGSQGELRDATDGPDGALYVLTNWEKRDGRADDRVLRISRR